MAGVPSSTPFLTTMSRPGRDATRIRPSGVAATAVGLATAATRVSVKPDGTVAASAGTAPTAINDTVSTATMSDDTKNDDTKNDDTKNEDATRRKRNRITR